MIFRGEGSLSTLWIRPWAGWHEKKNIFRKLIIVITYANMSYKIVFTLQMPPQFYQMAGDSQNSF